MLFLYWISKTGQNIYVKQGFRDINCEALHRALVSFIAFSSFKSFGNLRTKLLNVFKKLSVESRVLQKWDSLQFI